MALRSGMSISSEKINSGKKRVLLLTRYSTPPAPHRKGAAFTLLSSYQCYRKWNFPMNPYVGLSQKGLLELFNYFFSLSKLVLYHTALSLRTSNLNKVLLSYTSSELFSTSLRYDKYFPFNMLWLILCCYRISLKVFRQDRPLKITVSVQPI